MGRGRTHTREVPYIVFQVAGAIAAAAVLKFMADSKAYIEQLWFFLAGADSVGRYLQPVSAASPLKGITVMIVAHWRLPDLYLFPLNSEALV